MSSLSPVHPSQTPRCHDATDLLAIDPALGGEAGLARLVEPPTRGLRLVLDVAPTPVHAAHPAFQDALAKGRRSRFAARCDDWARPAWTQRPCASRCLGVTDK